jgi:hypothetical protein
VKFGVWGFCFFEYAKDFKVKFSIPHHKRWGFIKNKVLFKHRGSEGSVTILSGVTVIGERVFAYNSNIVSVSIP